MGFYVEILEQKKRGYSFDVVVIDATLHITKDFDPLVRRFDLLGLFCSLFCSGLCSMLRVEFVKDEFALPFPRQWL